MKIWVLRQTQGSGYQSPGGGYQSPGGGSGSSPQYETQSTLMVDQSTSNTGIPHPSSGQTWYQSFTAEHSSKLQKFAFVTNGAFTASATVKIREGEGVTGTVLHTGTWTGIGSNTNNYNEYAVGNGVVLTQGQKYTIQLENQTAGGFIGSNANQYAGGKFHYSGYGGEYGDLKMKIWVLRQTQGSGYQSPGGGYQSPGGGSGSSPQYETQSTLMVDQSTSNTGIPHPSSGQTWYQSFTAEHSSKLQKFAFVTNGAFTASATVKIREGEGVTGTVLHTGTWTGIGSNTNNYNEYVIGNDVVLTQGQKYTIQLENQTAGGFIGSNANQYAGGKFHYSGYGGEYGDLKMKIWVLRQTQGSGYQSPGGGYQSPGGGSGSSPQYETQSTLMVDQSTSNTGIPHPSSGQTWYQSFTAEHSSKLQKFAFVTNGAFTASATVKIREGEGVTGTVLHTGTWTGIGSNTNNYNEYVVGNDIVLTQGQKYTIQLENQTAGGFIGSNANQYAGGKFHYSGYGGEYGDLKMKIWVLRQTQGSGYQSPGGGYQTSGSGYQSGGSGYQSPGHGYQTPGHGYQSPGHGYQSPGHGYQSPGHGYQTPGHGYQSPGHGYQSPGHGYQSPEHGYQSPGHGYQTPGHGYQSPGHGYQTPTDGNDILDFANQITQVRTVGHQILPDDILLTGELLDQNISAIRMIEVGFYVSPSMQLSPNDSSTQKISAERNGSGVFSANIDTGTHQVLYFRAYAQTPRRTALGNVRKISIEGNLNKDNQGPEQEALSILAIDSVEENAGWIRNPWFGRYKNFNNGWIYHFDHGWLYLSSDDFNGIWAWSESRGWVWSKKGLYPFLYQSNLGNWIYFLTNQKGEVRYYNYSTNQFEDALP